MDFGYLANLEISRKLDQIEKRLIRIEESITEIKESNNKMNNHIDFVDSVFTVCKKPFNGLLSYYHGEDIKIDKMKLKEIELPK